MLIDTRIIHAHGATAVLAHRQEVMFRDGSPLLLHSVHLHGLEAPLLRALQVDNEWALLDLARALPALGDDIRCQPRRDAHGLVFFHLRGRWGSAGACVAALRPHLQLLQGGGAAALDFSGPGAAVYTRTDTGTTTQAQRRLVERSQAVAAA